MLFFIYWHFNHARKTEPLSMHHSILIKTRSRLNDQPAVPLLKGIFSRNSGFSSGLQSYLRKQEITGNHILTQHQNSFIAKFL